LLIASLRSFRRRRRISIATETDGAPCSLRSRDSILIKSLARRALSEANDARMDQVSATPTTAAAAAAPMCN